MTSYSSLINPAATRAERSTAAPVRTTLWVKGLAFTFGFFSQFNVLVGGSGEGAAASGGFGYRAADILCVLAIVLFGFRALVPRRLVPLVIFSIGIAAISLIRVLDPTIGGDPRTVILALHYLAYVFAGLYLAMLLDQAPTRDGFCWGLILGLLATIPIFAMQATGQSSTLVSLGLIPGYYRVLQLDVGDTLRYAGLWGHPNEAAHVAALAAPAGAYLYFAQRRILPLLLVGAALLAVFYYTQSRGGFLVGGGILGVPFLFGRQGQINIPRLLLAAVVIGVFVELASQIDFISTRFEDAGSAGNLAERLNTIWFGLEIALTHPFGLSIPDFYSTMSAGTGGVVSPHNGFIFFAVIFGWLPSIIMIAAIARTLSIRSDGNAFFALTSLGIVFSFMFEQLPGSYPFAFVICTIVGWAFLNTKIGNDLRMDTSALRNNGRPVSGRNVGLQPPVGWKADR